MAWGSAFLWACCLALSGCAAWRSTAGADDPHGPATVRPPQQAPGAAAPSVQSVQPAVDGGSAVAAAAQAASPQQFSGRLSLRVLQPRTGAIDGGTLLFEFGGTADEGSLQLQTVIGTAVATARWTPLGAEIVTAQGKRTGGSLDEVATTLLGQELPLAAILHWVRAEPWSRVPHERLADGFMQLGWSISLEGWHERMITARRSARPDRPNDLDITVRARLDEPTSAAPGGTTP